MEYCGFRGRASGIGLSERPGRLQDDHAPTCSRRLALAAMLARSLSTTSNAPAPAASDTRTEAQTDSPASVTAAPIGTPAAATGAKGQAGQPGQCQWIPERVRLAIVRGPDAFDRRRLRPRPVRAALHLRLDRPPTLPRHCPGRDQRRCIPDPCDNFRAEGSRCLDPVDVRRRAGCQPRCPWRPAHHCQPATGGGPTSLSAIRPP